MAIIKTSLEAAVHSIGAEIVQRERDAFEKKNLLSCVTLPTFAITARVIAAASQVLWLVHETVNFLPRMLRITYSLAENSSTPLSPQFFHKAGSIYGLYLKTVGAQFLTGTLAVVAPEIAYGSLELQKPLFALQLEAFLQTLPDLPHVQKHVRETYPTVETLVTLYTRLGFTNTHWKKALHRTIKKINDFDPIQASQFLTTKTRLFQEGYYQALASLVSERLNQFQREKKFDRAVIEGLDPAVWLTIQGFMRDETKEQLIGLLKEMIPNAENTNIYIALHKQIVSEYRTLDALLGCQVLFEKMKGAREELVAKELFTNDDIIAMYGESYDAVLTLGILRFIESGQVKDTTITFTAVDGRRCSFSRDLQFFGEKRAISLAKDLILTLTATDKEDLLQIICGKDVAASQAVHQCYQLIQGIKTRTIDKKIASENTIAWAKVFSE